MGRLLNTAGVILTLANPLASAEESQNPESSEVIDTPLAMGVNLSRHNLTFLDIRNDGTINRSSLTNNLVLIEAGVKLEITGVEDVSTLSVINRPTVREKNLDPEAQCTVRNDKEKKSLTISCNDKAQAMIIDNKSPDIPFLKEGDKGDRSNLCETYFVSSGEGAKLLHPSEWLKNSERKCMTVISSPESKIFIHEVGTLLKPTFFVSISCLGSKEPHYEVRNTSIKITNDSNGISITTIYSIKNNTKESNQPTHLPEETFIVL